MTLLLAGLVLLTSPVLAGCGQKGPLTLPAQAGAAASAAASAGGR